MKDDLLEKHDDFFEKAKKFAEGGYTDSKKDEIKIVKQSGEGSVKPKDPGVVKGFEDLDGDGDEIIDDAIVVDDND